MNLPVVIYQKIGDKRVLPVKKTYKDVVDLEIRQLCQGNEMLMKEFDYVMYEPTTNTILIGVEQNLSDFFNTLH